MSQIPSFAQDDHRGGGRIDDSIEPKTCSQCPFWKESDRTPGVGRCNQFDELTINWELPGDLCLVLFWTFAMSAEPAHAAAL